MTLLERDREKIEEGIEKGRKQGLEEGRKQGLEEGRSKGIVEGEKRGIEKGKIEGEIEGIELAKRVFKLFNKGETLENIAKICEISEAKVKEIIE